VLHRCLRRERVWHGRYRLPHLLLLLVSRVLMGLSMIRRRAWREHVRQGRQVLLREVLIPGEREQVRRPDPVRIHLVALLLRSSFLCSPILLSLTDAASPNQTCPRRKNNSSLDEQKVVLPLQKPMSYLCIDWNLTRALWLCFFSPWFESGRQKFKKKIRAKHKQQSKRTTEFLSKKPHNSTQGSLQEMVRSRLAFGTGAML